jgi:cyclopropane fatty-acyl-phospholipid synthase-like methyltransferase
MNYGLWDKKNNNLKKANINLINFIFDKTNLKNKSNMDILDVGCGYGEQDLLWSKKLNDTNKIIAIDISKSQINYAKSKNNEMVKFKVCDALLINKKFNNTTFDVIISLESAFHYINRCKFFDNVKSLLKPNGKFIITDIMLKNSYKPTLTSVVFINIFADFLHIPRVNLITGKKWKKQLSKRLKIVEIYDITKKTFKPYYTFFMKSYIKNMKLPNILSKILTDFFCNNQPFSYKIAICENYRCDAI